ncbi:hypothetical protein RUM43_000157 [Polyplax serrata]|uniref:RNA polymerase II-associated protein 1 n=1 Tax=Polyplax serrata TaxID=468196 RepID=A0AAN8SCE0_POLSC
MLQRPKINETEDDLLHQQAEYMKAMGKSPLNESSRTDNTQERKQSDVLVIIKERKYPFSVSSYEFSSKQHEGFPEAFKIEKPVNVNRKVKKSLFAQEIEKNRKKVKGSVYGNEIVEAVETMQVEKTDFHLTCSGLKDVIHEENLKKLSQLSPTEILEEQRKLLQTMDPNLQIGKFIANREIEEDQEVTANREIEEDQEVRCKLQGYFDTKWLNMDFIEKEKLEWIGDIPDKKALEPDQPYSARFNFKGELQPFAVDIDVRSSLYHHGDEPERPGYTIQELYQLSRSQVLQQRILALNTLGNLIRKTKLGYYDDCFDGQLLHKLLESDLFFLLRFSIDEYALISTSIFCLYNLLCNECDEFCLDKLLGVTNLDEQPQMFCDMDTITKEEEGELKDHVVIGCDLIKGVLRTDLLLRMSYILNKCSPSRETTCRIINCLIRISRHSKESARKVLDTPDLLRPLYQRMRSGVPQREGIKLFRILSCHSCQIASELIRQYDMRFFVNFLEVDENAEMSRKDFYLLKLETLYFWKNLMNYNLMVEEFLSWTPSLIRLLLFYKEKVDVDVENEFDFELFTALASLIIVSVEKTIFMDSNVTQFMGICLEKWLRQSINQREYSMSLSKALGSILRYFVEYLKVFGVTNSDLNFINKTNSLLMHWIQSTVCVDMATALVTYSYILCPTSVVRDPDNLPSLCSVYSGGNDFLKLAQSKSSLPFFMSLVNYLATAHRISRDTRSTVTLFLSIEPLRKYVTSFMNSEVDENRWFMKYETNFLIDIVRLMYCTKDSLLFPLCFRLLPVLRMDDEGVKTILETICDATAWKEEHEFFYGLPSIYLEILTVANTVKGKYKCDLVPKEWPYKILAHLRGREDTAAVVKVLAFLVFLLKSRSQYLDGISHTLRFYYLCYVFLTDSNVFDEKVQDLVASVLLDVMKHTEELRLDRKLDKNKSFYDLYTELITQYAGVSYGLPVFAQFVLLPLLNSQDVAFRKLVWFEYLHVLRVVTLPISVDNVPPIRSFVEPCESDESLLIAYLNSTCNGLITKVRNPFVYGVAVGNLNKFLVSGTRDVKLFNFIKKKVNGLQNRELRDDILNFCL